jgi:hypothetical protein
MLTSRLGNLIPLLLYATGVVAGDVHEQSLVGCDWFNQSDSKGCTTVISRADHEPHDRCHSLAYRYQAIGMKRIESIGDEDLLGRLPSQLMWSQGMQVGRDVSDFNWWQPMFYLTGLPPQHTPPESCAVVLHQREPRLQFPDWNADPASATGTCADALDQPCIDALLAKASDIVRDHKRSDICFALSDALGQIEKNRQLLPECANGRNADLDFGKITSYRKCACVRPSCSVEDRITHVQS